MWHITMNVIITLLRSDGGYGIVEDDYGLMFKLMNRECVSLDFVIIEEFNVILFEGCMDRQCRSLLYLAGIGKGLVEFSGRDSLGGDDPLNVRVKFMIKDLGKLKYFLGIEVIDTNKGICLNHRKYVLDLLSEYGMLSCKPVDTPLLSKLVISNEATKSDPVLENKLIYLTNNRPDILYAVHCLSQFIHSPLKFHLKIAFKILRYLKDCPGLGVHFVKTSGMFLKDFSDADWAKCVVTRKFVTDYRCDSNSSIKIEANPVFHERTKHLEIDLHFVREKILKGVVKTVKVEMKGDVKMYHLNLGDLLCEQVKEKNKSKKLKGGTKRKCSSRNDQDGKKKKVNKVVVSNEVTTLLKGFIDKIMGSDMKLVIQKMLFESDLKRSQNRLNMSFKQVETHDFLTDEEIRFLDRKSDDAEIEVQLVGPNLQMFNKPMCLKIWNMTNTKNYVLKTNWCDFVEANKKVLKEKATIQVWSFRKDEQLCFAVVCVDEPVINRMTLEEASSAGGSLLIS
ncbi:ribonuclease H-like domain-containing protein [Tanacetum coccineum]